MKISSRIAFFVFVFSCLYSCDSFRGTESPALIPKPASLQSGKALFRLNAATSVQVSDTSSELMRLGNSLISILKPATGFAFTLAGAREDSTNRILLKLSKADSALGLEGYRLQVSERQITITGYQPAGVFYGIQSLRQLLPADIEQVQTVQNKSWEIAEVDISDKPEYGYRGAMLDVARHFFSVEDVKRYIDLIAAYKINILHLHLTDDQGWRIEIKSWPKLTEVGGSTQVGGGKGGYYTQEQYKDIIEYASERFVTVIPEIDMPGHTNAAIVSYPWLNCRDTVHTLYTGIEVGFSTLCAGKDSTYLFVEDVIRELAAITPGPWIHMGGDESHVTSPEDYVKFVNRVQPLVNKYGKKAIGWDEIANADLLPNTTVQFWADVPNSKLAVSKGAKVIMSPSNKAYLDMQYDSTTRIGLNWAGFIEVDDAYNWDPATFTEGISRKDIIGVEAPLWTETVLNMDDIEYMVFPRLPGIAELGWSGGSGRDWNEYKKRLAKHGSRFKARGVDYYASKKVPWE